MLGNTVFFGNSAFADATRVDPRPIRQGPSERGRPDTGRCRGRISTWRQKDTGGHQDWREAGARRGAAVPTPRVRLRPQSPREHVPVASCRPVGEPRDSSPVPDTGDVFLPCREWPRKSARGCTSAHSTASAGVSASGHGTQRDIVTGLSQKRICNRKLSNNDRRGHGTAMGPIR